jgi:hypothetical protein
MLVNFGDNRNGKGVEEPAEQPGSLAAATEEVTRNLQKLLYLKQRLL